MHFDEPDVRDAYRRGARDCLESMIRSTSKHRQIQAIEAWVEELDSWHDSEEPPPPPV